MSIENTDAFHPLGRPAIHVTDDGEVEYDETGIICDECDQCPCECHLNSEDDDDDDDDDE